MSKLLCRDFKVITFEVRCFMTIDDELIYEIIRPNRHGEVGEKALIVKVVGTKNVKYRLEESTWYWKTYVDRKEKSIFRTKKDVIVTPDIIVTLPKESNKQIAIEFENDVQWDFGESLRQVKKYRDKFPDTRIIIPEEYKRFAPLYKNEGFRVYLWKAKRKWQCLRCGAIAEKEGPVSPKCKKCKKYTEHRLIGVKDVGIEEYM